MKNKTIQSSKTKIVLIDGTEELKPNVIGEALKKMIEGIGDFGMNRSRVNDQIKWPTGTTSTEQQCLHKNCVGCKNGTCSGIHMISCPCRSCTPWA